jgi:hypothetical protein
MDTQEKERLIKAINSKGLRNSLISIYYNIGRALPFRAQRFPDGRVSDWYRSQFVEVHSVKPSGKGGKYGDAYGFYYRNGERADAWENDPEGSWCKIEIHNHRVSLVGRAARGFYWIFWVNKLISLPKYMHLMTPLNLVNIRAKLFERLLKGTGVGLNGQ